MASSTRAAGMQLLIHPTHGLYRRLGYRLILSVPGGHRSDRRRFLSNLANTRIINPRSGKAANQDKVDIAFSMFPVVFGPTLFNESHPCRRRRNVPSLARIQLSL